MVDKLDKAAFDEGQITIPKDLDLVRSTTDPDRQEVIACSFIKHRRPDKLSVDDPAPALELTYLSSAETTKMVNLASVNDQPLVLFFGSYT